MKTFIHIPKTGGTTMVNTLSKQILFNRFKRLNPTRTTHPKDFLDSVEGLLEDVVSSSKFDVVGGHFGFAAHPKLMDASQYFTVLRDPIERVISEYYYMKHKGMYYQGLIEKENLSLTKYVSHPETFYLNNLQTRLISGVSFESGDTVTESTYKLALENLSKFKVFGLTEQMDSTLALFYIILNWNHLPYYQRSNANEKRPNTEHISQHEIDVIREREKYDILLYEKAKQIFQRRLIDNGQEINQVIGRIQNPGKFHTFYLKVLNKLRN